MEKVINYESRKCKELIDNHFVNHNEENKYFEDFGCFDIETTNKVKIDGNEMPVMFCWQFQLGEHTIIGRRWYEYIEFINNIKSVIGKNRNKNPNYRYIIYVHNLTFEETFLRSVFNYTDENVFFYKNLAYTLKDECIEYRCSQALSGVSLEEFTKGCEHEKKSGEDFDYSKIRFPWTKLTESELAYAVNDVLGLREAVNRLLKINGYVLEDAPITQRGFIMDDLTKSFNKEKNNYDIFKSKFDNIKSGTNSTFDDSYEGKIHHPPYECYKYIKEATHGGNTCAARGYRSAYFEGETQDILLKNVVSYDAKKFYPSIMIQERFPVGRWEYQENISIKDLARFTNNDYAWCAKLVFKNIRLKDPNEPIPYIPYSKHHGEYTVNPVWYLKRRLESADSFGITVTDVDFAIIDNMYDYDEVLTNDCWISKYGFLPKYVKKVIKDKYFELLKLKKGTIEYANVKANFNSLHGKAGRDRLAKNGSDEEKSKGLYNVERSWDILPFPWYTWGTAIGRYLLQDCINRAKDKVVYCAVDSIKTLGTVDLSEHNKRCYDRVHGVATREEMMSPEYNVMGCFVPEWTAKECKVVFSSIYAYTTEEPIKLSDKDREWAKKVLKLTDKQLDKFNLVITISGVSKTRGALELYAKGGLSELKAGFNFEYISKKTRKTIKRRYEIVNYEGNELEICGGTIIEEKLGFKIGEMELQNLTDQVVKEGIMEVYKDACKKQFF